jgi:AraC-like DNA-binding protein
VGQSYRERPPASALAGQVSCVWVQSVASGSPPLAHRTVPNGSAEIHAVVGSAVQVTGPRLSPTVTAIAPGTTVVGIRLRPGAAYPLLSVPASELAGRQVGLGELWGRDGDLLAERLAEAGSAAAAARLLEGALRPAGAAPDPLVTAAVRMLGPWRAGSVSEVAAALGVSTRHLRRRCLHTVGYGAKTIHRILRFQGFLALAGVDTKAHGEAGLARLAADAGYADQAHLTRDCGRLAGLTPRAFLAERAGICGPTHDHAASFRPLLAARDRS